MDMALLGELRDALPDRARILPAAVDEHAAHRRWRQRRPLLAVGVRMVEARAEVLAERRIAQAGEAIAGRQRRQVAPVEHAVEERRAAPPVEWSHERLRAEHRVDRRALSPPVGEEAGLVA